MVVFLLFFSSSEQRTLVLKSNILKSWEFYVYDTGSHQASLFTSDSPTISPLIDVQI